MTNDEMNQQTNEQMTDDESGTNDRTPDPVSVPRQVHCELKTLRQMRTHDLLSEEVLEALDDYGFEATREWILDNPDRYVRAVYCGTEDRTIADDSS